MEDFEIIFEMIQELKQELLKLNRPINPFVETRSLNIEIKNNVNTIRQKMIEFLRMKEKSIRQEIIELKKVISASTRLNDEELLTKSKEQLKLTHQKYQQNIILLNEMCNIFGHSGTKTGKYYKCSVCNRLVHETNYKGYEETSNEQLKINLSRSFLSKDQEHIKKKMLELLPSTTYEPEDFMDNQEEVEISSKKRIRKI